MTDLERDLQRMIAGVRRGIAIDSENTSDRDIGWRNGATFVCTLVEAVLAEHSK